MSGISDQVQILVQVGKPLPGAVLFCRRQPYLVHPLVPQSVPQITSVTFAAIEVYEVVAGGPTSVEAPGPLIGPVA